VQRVEGEAVIQQKSGRIEVIAVEQVGQVGRIVVATTGGCCCTTMVMFEYSKDKWTAHCLVSDWNRVATNLKVVWWRERIGTLLRSDTEKSLNPISFGLTNRQRRLGTCQNDSSLCRLEATNSPKLQWLLKASTSCSTAKTPKR